MSTKSVSPSNPPQKVAGLILAAGMGTRMGRPKQLLPVPVSPRGGQEEKVVWTPLIRRILQEAISSRLHHVVVVLGHKGQETLDSISDLLEPDKVSVIYNREYEKGLGKSIRTGLEFLKGDYDHAMILLADMIHIDRGLIDSFLKAYLDSGAPLGAVRIEGRRSHPVIFSRRLFQELSSLEGDLGGRALFHKYSSLVFLWNAPPGLIELDIDTPEDYARLIKPFVEKS